MTADHYISIALGAVLLCGSLFVLAKVFSGALKVRWPDNPTTHNYQKPWWGHHVIVNHVLDEGVVLRVSGFGGRFFCILPVFGDFVVLNNNGAPSTYRIREIEHCRDPADMWKATLWHTNHPQLREALPKARLEKEGNR